MNVGQVVAAMAGGALLTVAAISVLVLHMVWRRSERERRIEAAVGAVVAGAETFRQQAATTSAPQAAQVVHAKGHLRLIRSRGARRLGAGVCRERSPEVESFDDALVRSLPERGQDV